jgi:hypothetical protein
MIGKIASKRHDELVGLIFLSQKWKERAETLFLEASCDHMCDGGLAHVCLAEENEPMFRFRILNPLEDIVLKIFACVWKTAFLVLNHQARQFSDIALDPAHPLLVQ